MSPTIIKVHFPSTMRAMRIAAIDELAETPRAGGAAWITLEIADYLNSTGRHTVDVISFHEGLRPPVPTSVKYVPYLRELSILPLAGRRSIPRFEDAYDLLLVSSPTLLSLYSPATRVVLYIHCLYSRQVDLFSRYLPPAYRVIFNGYLKRVFSRLEAPALRRADLILCPRKALVAYLQQESMLRSKSVLDMPVGVDLERFKPIDEAERNNSLLFVGRASLAKGFDTFLKVAKDLGIDSVAVIPRESMLSSRHALPGNVRIVVAPGRKDLVKLYQQAGMFLMPSLSETGPLVTIEAMACGLPIVCTSEGGGDYVLPGRNGFVVEPNDYKSMSDRVKLLNEDEDLRAEMGRASRETATKFDLSRMLEEFEGTLELAFS